MLPLYGTCVAFRPAALLKYSPTRCAVAPVPDEAKVYLPGLAFSSATNSRAFAAGNAVCATRMYGEKPALAMGARSRSDTYGTLSNSGLMVTGPLDAASSV